MAKKSKNRSKKSLGKRLWRVIWITPLLLFALSIISVVALKWVPVYYTPLMLKRAIEYRDDHGFHTIHRWVPIEKISPELMKAVITSEDNRFMEHHGFDWEAIKDAKKWNDDHTDPVTGEIKHKRGGSGISQQTAKNVFTFCGSNLRRKIVESYFTVLIEWIWGKERIMEVYLNVAEFGPGVYGVQSAAEVYLCTDAAHVGRQKACIMAACLPSPLKRSISHPSQYVRRRAEKIRRLIPNLNYPDWIEHHH